jgi:hypothetical protein
VIHVVAATATQSPPEPVKPPLIHSLLELSGPVHALKLNKTNHSPLLVVRLYLLNLFKSLFSFDLDLVNLNLVLLSIGRVKLFLLAQELFPFKVFNQLKFGIYFF